MPVAVDERSVAVGAEEGGGGQPSDLFEDGEGHWAGNFGFRKPAVGQPKLRQQIIQMACFDQCPVAAMRSQSSFI